MRKLKWKFEVSIEVDEIWVADGFNPTASQMSEIIDDAILSYAAEYEKKVKVKLLERADQKTVAKAQGYKTVSAMRKDDWDCR